MPSPTRRRRPELAHYLRNFSGLERGHRKALNLFQSAREHGLWAPYGCQVVKSFAWTIKVAAACRGARIGLPGHDAHWAAASDGSWRSKKVELWAPPRAWRPMGGVMVGSSSGFVFPSEVMKRMKARIAPEPHTPWGTSEALGRVDRRFF